MNRQPILSDYPDAVELLDALGIVVDDTDEQRFVGRNPCWRGRDLSGESVFVKREDRGGTRKFFRMRTVNAELRSAVTVIEPSATSADGRIQVYPWHQSPSGSEQLAAGKLGRNVVIAVAADIARLHSTATSATVPAAEPLPGTYGIPSLPIAALPGLSGGQLAVWTLLHSDTEVLDTANATVLADPPEHLRRYIHGDLRTDQILLDEHDEDAFAAIIDWESFGSGDPARDTGTFMGNLLNIVATREIVTAKRAEAEPDWQHEMAGAMMRSREFMVDFLTAYFDGRPGIPAESIRDHIRRAIRFAGWHQFDRLLACSDAAPTVTPFAKALAGVGRTFLLFPDEIDEELSLTDACTHTR
ncbi:MULTISPECIES: phosphotransferase [Nocardia]|uniref:Phosphotransferase n=1 Tax=Nocardia elegans TaxID=300029 RepID=A0ABW6T7A6_9NOCA|nr:MULTISPECIES: phosphotransferase [Nocardia]MBF6242231.1 phosphotransferase [Nocardia elegans]MBF6446938.1 phosphotransferase [Nocardia elegans]